MTNLNVIMNNLIELKDNYEQWVVDKENAEDQEERDELEDYVWWEGEYGNDLVWQIDCHPIFKGDRPCLLDERHVKMDDKGLYKVHCCECKARWLMEIYE